MAGPVRGIPAVRRSGPGLHRLAHGAEQFGGLVDLTVREHRDTEAAMVGPAANGHPVAVRGRCTALHGAAERTGRDLVNAVDATGLVCDQTEALVERFARGHESTGTADEHHRLRITGRLG